MPEPPHPSETLGEADLSTMNSALLAVSAQAAVADKKYDIGAQLQHWSVINGESPDGMYNLACYYSLAGQVDAAIYFLQKAAAEEGVDSDWAGEDFDLTLVRADSRWQKIHNYLKQYNRYWETCDLSETVLILPTGYDGKEAIPVVIGLHGMGSRPSHFIFDDYQEFADELHVAFLGVSGSVPKGPTSFVWAENVTRDDARIDACLKEVEGQLVPAKGKLVLIGFSQVGKMAGEIAAFKPEKYAGGIIMSPGGFSESRIGQLSPGAAHFRQGFVATCNAGERPGNVRNTREYADQLKRLEAHVKHISYPGLDTHSLPPDYWEKLPEWITFILDPLEIGL
ncbi:MAG: hypothetical protein KDA88_16770 [Planctomycetaceae bacterium]|nr:hypothetical protein [Planctomycetaceae bacterium]